MTTMSNRMGRPATYTEEMDEVILTTPLTEDVNRIFEENGWPIRSTAAIIQRRQYLIKRLGRSVDYEVRSLADRYNRCMERKRRLVSQLADAHECVKRLERQLEAVNQEIIEVTEEMRSQADEESPPPSNGSS